MEQAVIEIFVDLLDAAVQANKTASSNKLHHSPDYNPYPIWLLLILFEQLVLFPSLREDPKESDSTLNQLIHHQLRLFRSGQIKRHFMMKAEKFRARLLAILHQIQESYSGQYS